MTQSWPINHLKIALAIAVRRLAELGEHETIAKIEAELPPENKSPSQRRKPID
jgi:hypothetical protein